MGLFQKQSVSCDSLAGSRNLFVSIALKLKVACAFACLNFIFFAPQPFFFFVLSSLEEIIHSARVTSK